jgi:5-formyltetrahydrofolate cyclo-ligase
MTSKSQLRHELLAKRREIADKSARDAGIFEQVTALPEFASADTVLTYMSTASEVDTRRLIKHCHDIGKTVAVPAILVSGSAEEMQFFRLTPDFDLDVEQSVSRGLCIVPGVAFSEEGFRLGYGGGYYDRFLSANDVFSVGLCYRELITEVPTEPHDKRVNIVIVR